MPPIEKLPNDVLERICDIMGDTGTGWTNDQIYKVLSATGIDDIASVLNKRTRLFRALEAKQHRDNSPNHIFRVIHSFVNPVNYVGDKNLHRSRLEAVNKILVFAGYHYNEAGELIKVNIARTISEAQQRVGRVRTRLKDRNVHDDVLTFCNEELLEENYFHAVFEATKSIADKIRYKTGLGNDGAQLINDAFALGQDIRPILAFNTLKTESEQSEHKGFQNLLIGTFGMIRNVTAHTPRVNWIVNEDAALDYLTLVSFIHRKLDTCHRTGW